MSEKKPYEAPSITFGEAARRREVCAELYAPARKAKPKTSTKKSSSTKKKSR